jgi:Chaperone of endosialidase
MRTPKPADPVATAGAQAGQNTMAANANTIAQSGSVTNPYGTRSSDIEYLQTRNPLTGKMENVARNNVTEKLSSGQQAIFDQNQSSDYNLASYGNTQAQRLNSPDAKPFEYNTGDHEQWFARNYNTLNAENNAQADEALRTRLSNQGIKQGSAQFDREIKSQSAGQSNAFLNALMGSQQQGYQQAQATRNQQFNEPLAISSGTQLQNANFNPANVGNVANVDYAGIRSNYDNQRMQGFQAKQAMYGGLFSGIGSALALSDRRAKKDIKHVGVVKGQKVYEYRYKGQDSSTPKTIGVMAQELMKIKPEAVVKGSDGMFRVDYQNAFSLGA